MKLLCGTGSVAWFNEKRGIGFIVQDGAGMLCNEYVQLDQNEDGIFCPAKTAPLLDVFVHQSVIHMSGYRSLTKGGKIGT